MDTTQKIKSRFPDLNFIKPLPVDKHPRYQKHGLKLSPNSSTALPKGHLKEAGRRKILVESILERDTPILLRDGLKVYADVLRPRSSDEVKVPAAICWSPYGKATSGLVIDGLPHRLGIPKDRTSGYETFEGLDPADWCNRGYAVVNVDARGSQFSEGTYFFWGMQEAEDIYDAIEYLSKQPWCNGSVCMAGNSYLAKAQVSFASRLSHPALKALAPWEGFTDIYRQLYCRGGFAMNNLFAAGYQFGVAGEHEVEDMAGMVKSHPLFDDYWADKYDEVEKIDVPLYLVSSFSNPFHIYGSFDTFRRAQSKQKWLRVHSTFEWYDLYDHASNDDLQRFLDRYCKGIMNGWEQDTPPLRLSLIGFDGSLPNIVQRPEKEFPLSRQRLQKFYLDGATKTLHASPRDSEASVSHDGHSLGVSSDFILKFTQYTEVVGYAKVHLWMSCKEKDDMDVVVQIRKIGKSGTPLTAMNFPCPAPISEVPDTSLCKTFGPQGFLRASSLPSRDDTRSSSDGQEIFYRHDREEKISPGTIVPLEITLWPMGMIFAEGEGIMLRIAGHFLSAPLYEMNRLKEPDDQNVGQHCIHTGGTYDSYLTIPIVSGDRG